MDQFRNISGGVLQRVQFFDIRMENGMQLLCGLKNPNWDQKMNVNFKVLWFEDEMGWRPSSERSMKRIIESHNLVPIITWKKGDEGDAEEELKKPWVIY